MQLTKVEVRNYRSIFEQSSTQPGLRLDLASGLNVLVGRNNCGKSNLFRALSAALDPTYQLDPFADLPGPMPHRYPSIQVWFQCDPANPGEAELLDQARDYERLANDSEVTRAAKNQIVLRVTFAPTESGGYGRRERIVFADGSDEPRSENAEINVLPGVIAKLHSHVRFILVQSGESIESVLEGSFREILHSVVQQNMGMEFAAAEESRQDYIKGLQSELLGPLREIVEKSVERLFPEIAEISFSPDVSDIESTLSRVRIGLVDAVSTPLSQKGTGVRGGILVAMLRYLASNTNRCVVFAVEEPEAFLHPAAQEDLRADLEELASQIDVSVLLTTHSPYILSKEADAMSVLLDKDNDGRTIVAATSRAGDARVAVVSGIVKEGSFEDVLAAGAVIGPDKAGVLLVEGYGDKQYLKMAAKRLGRPGLVSDLEIIPSNGCSRMAFLASLTRASTQLPIGVLLDNDEPGIQAKKRILALESHETQERIFPRKRVFGCQQVFDSKYNYFPWEAEDLFPSTMVQEFVDSVGGPYVAKGMVARPDGGMHFDLGQEHKILLAEYLDEKLLVEHLDKWEQLLTLVRANLGLPDEAKTAVVEPSLNAPVPLPAKTTESETDERVLVVSQNFGHAEYRRSRVFVGEPGRGLSPDIRYIAFYENGEIREEVPRVLARHDDLVFDESLVSQLVDSDNKSDRDLAAYVADELETGRRAPGDTRQVFLLSSPEDPATFYLRSTIKNTKLSPKGRPMAWVVRHKLTWKHALTGGVSTTDELDAYEEGQSL
jgi:putative ATP-dependent endonuclease of the OLD family